MRKGLLEKYLVNENVGTRKMNIKVGSIPVTIAVDQSRFGTIYRIWNIKGVTDSYIDKDTGWLSLDLLKKEVMSIINNFERGVKWEKVY